jgi:hypothetical protein
MYYRDLGAGSASIGRGWLTENMNLVQLNDVLSMQFIHMFYFSLWGLGWGEGFLVGRVTTTLVSVHGTSAHTVFGGKWTELSDLRISLHIC